MQDVPGWFVRARGFLRDNGSVEALEVVPHADAGASARVEHGRSR